MDLHASAGAFRPMQTGAVAELATRNLHLDERFVYQALTRPNCRRHGEVNDDDMVASDWTKDQLPAQSSANRGFEPLTEDRLANVSS